MNIELLKEMDKQQKYSAALPVTGTAAENKKCERLLTLPRSALSRQR
jgi:hypothetical protein